jgi:cytoskeletal protein RodZ
MLNKKMLQELVVVILSIVLLTGISMATSIQFTIYGQQQESKQQQSQPKLEQNQTIDMSKMINQIGQQVAAANPDSNSTLVEQVIVQLAEHTAKTSSKAEINKQISQIASEVDKDPNGIVSQLISHFAQDLALEVGGNGYDDALVGEEQMPSVVTTLPDGEEKNNK